MCVCAQSTMNMAPFSYSSVPRSGTFPTERL